MILHKNIELLVKRINMQDYILCYQTEKGYKPCKSFLDDYITGKTIQAVNINST